MDGAFLSPLAKAERVLFLYAQEKNEKKPRTFRSIICAAGSGSVAAIKDGIHAREARVIRQSPPLSQVSCRKALTRRAPCACGRVLPTRSCVPHGEWWPVRAPRALQHLSSRVYVLPSRWMRVRDTVSATLFVVFSSVRKRHFFFFGKEKRVLFLSVQEKNEKKPQACRLTVRASQEHVSSAPGTCLRTAGVRNPRRNTPNGQRARSGSLAPAGAGFPVAVTLRTGSGGLCELCEHCNTFRAVGMHFPADGWEFEAEASTTLFVVFSSVRKRHLYSPL